MIWLIILLCVYMLFDGFSLREGKGTLIERWAVPRIGVGARRWDVALHAAFAASMFALALAR